MHRYGTHIAHWILNQIDTTHSTSVKPLYECLSPELKVIDDLDNDLAPNKPQTKIYTSDESHMKSTDFPNTLFINNTYMSLIG